MWNSTIGAFEATEASSNRNHRSNGIPDSAIVALSCMFARAVNKSSEDSFGKAIAELVDIALNDSTTRRAQVTVLRDLTRLISSEGMVEQQAKAILWQAIAVRAAAALTAPQPVENKNNGGSPQIVGHSFKDVVKILEAGIHYNSSENLLAWKDLQTVLANVMTTEVGGEGVALVLTEPLSAALVHEGMVEHPEFLCQYLTCLFRTAIWPKSQQSLERSQRLLWGVSIDSPKLPSNLFDGFFTLINIALNAAYSKFNLVKLEVIRNLFLTMKTAISLCPAGLQLELLRHLQKGVCVWVEDSKELITSKKLGSDWQCIYSAVSSPRKLRKEVPC